jgi:Ca2+-binding RTX toxin-like protein
MKSPVKIATVMLAMVAFAACGKGKTDDDQIATVRGALLPDETTPIGQKWRQLVNAGVPIGEATATVQSVPGYPAQYQVFVSGVIVFTNDHGAVYLTQAIFNKWQSLTGMTDAGGNIVYSYFGVPTKDYVAVTGGEEATFTSGLISVQGGVGRVVYGAIYLKYLTMPTALGAPLNEEAAGAIAGSRTQIFTGGEVYSYADPSGSPVAYAVLAGPILTKFQARGGIAATGLPLSDTAVIIAADGMTQRGLVGRFRNSGIYFNAATGQTFETQGGIFQEYERQGGPNGWLGFPITDSAFTPVNSFIYNDFEKGVLVWYETIPAVAPMLPTYRVAPFGDLQFYLQRVTALGDDCFLCGKPDLYYFLTVSNQNGFIINKGRFPSNVSDWGSDTDNRNSPMGFALTASHLTTFTGTVEVWESDNDFIVENGDDFRGTLSRTFNIDNLWGMNLPSVQTSGNGQADFSIKSTHAFQENDFRGQKYWSFENFSTPHLGYDVYAATFEDVTPDEAWYFNPFNAMYYELFFKGIADGGNCSGMNTEQQWASLGRSRIGMPIHDVYPDTQNGSELVASNPLHASLYREINIKQGYQLGIDSIAWRVQRFFTGNTHNPGGVFNDSKFYFDSQDPPTLSIYDDFWYGAGHSLMPYRWEGAQACTILDAPTCARIYVADPNFPTRGTPAAADGTRTTQPPGFSSPTIDRFVEVEIGQADNEYAYNGGTTTYRGGNWFGGRMFFQPQHTYLGTPVTPFYEPYLIATAAFIMIVADSGTTQQITDTSGRTFFEPGLGGPPTRWDQVRRDTTTRVPDVWPVLPTDKQTPGTNRPQIWYGQGFGSTHTYEIAAKPGVAAGTLIQSAFHAGTMSSRFLIPATLGQADKVIAHDINTFNKAISLALPASSVAKPVTWTISGAEKQRWMEFSNLGMAPAQAIKMQTLNANRKLAINNAGPATTAHLRIKGGPGLAVVDMGTVSIPSGDSTMDFQGPKTTLTMGGVVSGQNGWLIAPVTITLTTQDRSGAGIAATEYSTDNATWTAYTGPFQYANQGETVLFYRARDNAGNIEPSNSQAFKIDSRLPATTGSVSATGGSVTLTYAVTDPTPGSGVKGVHVVQTGGSTTFAAPASGTIPLAGTCSAVELWGEDIAGNMTTPHLVIRDSVKPVFTTVPPATVTSTACTVAQGLNIGTAAATDDCSGAITVTNNAPARFPLGVTVVTWTARDAAGNVETKTTTVITELGDSTACCPVGSNIIRGTSNNDTLTGTSGVDCILGFNGQDVIRGNGGNDAISGGGGDDDMWGGDGNDWIGGGVGQDKLRGENGNDILTGGEGDDWLWGGNNDDLLIGGMHQDQLLGEAGNDNLTGEHGFDTLNGGTGNDFLRGGTEIDNLAGGGGTDQCVQDGADNLSACTAVAP